MYKWNWERKKKDKKQFTLYELAALYPDITHDQLTDSENANREDEQEENVLEEAEDGGSEEPSES